MRLCTNESVTIFIFAFFFFCTAVTSDYHSEWILVNSPLHWKKERLARKSYGLLEGSISVFIWMELVILKKSMWDI
jgi:hypothetical protein